MKCPSFGHLQLMCGNKDDALLVQHVVDVLQFLPDGLALLLVLVRTEAAARTQIINLES